MNTQQIVSEISEKMQAMLHDCALKAITQALLIAEIASGKFGMHKIRCIVIYREITGKALRESKDAVDEFFKLSYCERVTLTQMKRFLTPDVDSYGFFGIYSTHVKENPSIRESEVLYIKYKALQLQKTKCVN